MSIDIRKAQIAGHAALRAARAEKDQATKGHPRVGSSGCVSADGDVYGVCPRKALLRSVGIEKDIPLYSDIMLKAGGEANEWHWQRILLGGLPDDLKQAEAPYITAVVDGVPLSVLGHPDVVLADATGTPTFGIELKGIFGASTAVLVQYKNTPKNENLIQAAAYSHFMQLPWALCYTSASYVALNHYDKKECGVSSIKPFYKTFYMEWRDSYLWYRDETQDAWIRTVVTGKGIEDYYRLIEEMKAAKDLGPRPSSHYVNGTPNKWGRDSMCGLCPFKQACDKYDGDKSFDAWVSNITTAVEEVA